ncbi:hypothetical protein [Marinobacter sp. HN1S83]|uniref:hypothetical protein n=1 Tax=Marinobacter sp. HN1S83 TaxID=3382301 RepID=UPI00387AD2F4
MNIQIFKICLPALFLLSACAASTGGLPGDPAHLKVEPELFCPGDEVTVSWDVSNMPRDRSHCSILGEGYDSDASCGTSPDCPTDGTCIDGYCCPSSFPSGIAQACPNHYGCYPPFELTVTADTLTLTPPVNGENEELTGSRTVMPTATTTFNGRVSFEDETYTMTETAEMVRLTPPSTPVYEFPFVCSSAGPGWQPLDLDEEYGWRERRYASDNVRVVNVRNTTSHTIELRTNNPAVGPITLTPGQVTDAFNGHPQGEWFVSLSPRDPAYLVIPRCEATDIADPWPDLQVEATLECANPDMDMD